MLCNINLFKEKKMSPEDLKINAIMNDMFDFWDKYELTEKTLDDEDGNSSGDSITVVNTKSGCYFDAEDRLVHLSGCLCGEIEDDSER